MTAYERELMFATAIKQLNAPKADPLPLIKPEQAGIYVTELTAEETDAEVIAA